MIFDQAERGEGGAVYSRGIASIEYLKMNALK
jgi:hypothetical protein